MDALPKPWSLGFWGEPQCFYSTETTAASLGQFVDSNSGIATIKANLKFASIHHDASYRASKSSTATPTAYSHHLQAFVTYDPIGGTTIDEPRL